MFQPLDVVFDENTTGSVCFEISIEDDDVYEYSEVFQISIMTPVDTAVNVTQLLLDITIFDEDSMCM